MNGDLNELPLMGSLQMDDCDEIANLVDLHISRCVKNGGKVTPIVDSPTLPKNGGVTDWYQELKIIMANIFPPDHVNDLPEVEPNQPDLAPAILKPALVDENKEPEEEEEFEEEKEFEEEEPQEEEEEDMEVDIGEEENEPELKFSYEEADPLNPPLPASDLEFKDGESSTATFLQEDGDSPVS
ncbi:hypothetical protein Tco_0566118 [Tanacetum coccineum]